MTQATPAVATGAPGQAWAVTAEKVDDVVNRLVAAASPLRLIAFGSAARGELTAANDLDLLVVESELTSRYSETVRLQKALLALHEHDYPRSHNIGLLLDLLTSHGLGLPERLEAVQTLTPFGTVFRYDDLPLEDTPDRHSWPPLLHDLQSYVTAAIEADAPTGEERSP